MLSIYHLQINSTKQFNQMGLHLQSLSLSFSLNVDNDRKQKKTTCIRKKNYWLLSGGVCAFFSFHPKSPVRGGIASMCEPISRFIFFTFIVITPFRYSNTSFFTHLGLSRCISIDYNQQKRDEANKFLLVMWCRLSIVDPFQMNEMRRKNLFYFFSSFFDWNLLCFLCSTSTCSLLLCLFACWSRY